jgi:hypothetical protein
MCCLKVRKPLNLLGISIKSSLSCTVLMDGKLWGEKDFVGYKLG